MHAVRTLPSILFAIAILFLIHFAHAESVTWSGVQPDLTTFIPPRMNMWLDDSMVSVSYNVAVWKSDASGAKLEPLSSGSTIPTGTYVLYEFVPHAYTDINWFGIGSGMDSPYGDWVADGEAPDPSVRCHDKNLYDTSYLEGPNARLDVYAALGVDIPSKTLAVSAGECTSIRSINKLCRFDTPTDVSAQFTFNATKGLFWGGWRGVDLGYPGTNAPPQCFSIGVATTPFSYNTGPSPFSSQNQGTDPPSNTEAFAPASGGWKVAVPTQTLTHTITVSAVPDDPTASTPSTPSLTSGGACVVGSPHTVHFVSTDPDNDNVRYGIDWDADGSVNEWVPPSGYMASGASQTASRTYSIAGSKTVKVMAQDEGGLSSAWATITFSCTQTPPPAGQCTDNADNDNDGFIDSLDPDCVATAGLSEFTTTTTPPPAVSLNAVLDIRAIPSLVRSGNTTKVNWSAQNVESCTVSATNGDAWSGLQSPVGGQTSRPITSETRYTLSCIDDDGSTHTKTATVRIIPTFQEL